MRVLILAGFLAVGLMHAESGIAIPSNARIYVDADTGFDVYLTAALRKRHVPLAVTTDKSKADYAIEEIPLAPGIRLVDLRNGDVVLAWPVDGKSKLHGRQAADACARSLAAGIHPSERRESPGFSKEPALDF